MKAKVEFRAELWRYPGKAGWIFATLPKRLSADIKKTHGHRSRGWGSLPVDVAMGGSKWKTSIFPDAKTGTYLLPVKASVRKKERVAAGDRTDIALTL